MPSTSQVDNCLFCGAALSADEAGLEHEALPIAPETFEPIASDYASVGEEGEREGDAPAALPPKVADPLRLTGTVAAGATADEATAAQTRSRAGNPLAVIVLCGALVVGLAVFISLASGRRGVTTGKSSSSKVFVPGRSTTQRTPVRQSGG
jgi:hypothetical protein